MFTGNYLLPMNLLKGGRQLALITSPNGSKILAALPNNASPQLLQNLASITSSTISNGQKLNEQHDSLSKIGLQANAVSTNKGTPKQEKSDNSNSLYCLRTVPNNPQFNKNQTNVSSSSSSSGFSVIDKDSSAIKNTQKSSVPTTVIISSQNRLKAGSSFNSKCGEDELLVNSSNSKAYQQQILLLKRDVELKDGIKDEDHKIFFTDGKVVDINAKMVHHQKQIALEKQLRLQKSLSEECEDLGVDEPEDLFPEADLLFDSPDNTNQDNVLLEDQEIKIELKIEDTESSKSQPNATNNFEHYTMGESDLGASTEVRTTKTLKKVSDMYEYTDGVENEQFIGDHIDNDNEIEYNRFFHKKLGRIGSAVTSLNKRKRIGSSPTLKKTKLTPESEESLQSEIEETTKLQVLGEGNKKKRTIKNKTELEEPSSTLAPSPILRRLSPRNHIKKNCDCSKKTSESTREITCTHVSNNSVTNEISTQPEPHNMQILRHKPTAASKPQAPTRIMSRKR